MIAAVLATAVFAGVWIAKATRDDAHHMMHGPDSGCGECDE